MTYGKMPQRFRHGATDDKDDISRNKTVSLYSHMRAGEQKRKIKNCQYGLEKSHKYQSTLQEKFRGDGLSGMKELR